MPDPSVSRLVCLFRGHTGQKEGGTLMFTCLRCGGSFWQPHDFSDLTRRANHLIAQGRAREALRMAREEIQRDA